MSSFRRERRYMTSAETSLGLSITTTDATVQHPRAHGDARSAGRPSRLGRAHLPAPGPVAGPAAKARGIPRPYLHYSGASGDIVFRPPTAPQTIFLPRG